MASTQAHAGGARQQNNCGDPLLMITAKRIDDLFNLFAVLVLRHRLANPGALHAQCLAQT